MIAGGRKPGLLAPLMVLGRRDMFIFLWFVMALCGWTPAVAVYIFLMALAYFLVAAIQLILPRSLPPVLPPGRS